MSTKLSLNADLLTVAQINSAFHRQAPLSLPQLLRDLLEWAQREKGLVLCEAYKPKYDWYTPIALPHGCSKTLRPALESVSSP